MHSSPLQSLPSNQRDTPMNDRVSRLRKRLCRGISRDTLMQDPHAVIETKSSMAPVVSSGVCKPHKAVIVAKKKKPHKKKAPARPRSWQKSLVQKRAEEAQTAQLEEKERACALEEIGGTFE